MNFELIREWQKVLFRELYSHKWWVLICFTLTSLSIVVIGALWPKQYQSGGIIHADKQNIIAPLLQGSAEVTRLARSPRQSGIVKDVLFSQRMIDSIAKQAGLLKGGERSGKRSSVYNSLRSGIQITDISENYVNISYTGRSAKETFEMTNIVIDSFIKSSADTKRRESKDAYQFIDRQVKTYKKQLQQAEEKLKNFHSANVDGSEATANMRIAQLRSDIVEMELNLEESLTRKTELVSQLKQEGRFLTQNYRADIYRERLSQARTQLETLRLNYQDTYPDIVSLKHQMEDMRRAIADAEVADTTDEGMSGESNLNPLYQELREQLSEIEVEIRSSTKRLDAIKSLLEEEYSRSKRIASHQAELSELTRDYDVTIEIYEDMLERKERARLSMTLDVEGQGVSYKIHEPPSYPLAPSGLRFRNFVFAGLPLGLLVSVGVMVLYILLDPRIRFPELLREELDLPVLGSIPRFSSSIDAELSRGENLWFGLICVVVLSAYASVMVFKVYGNF